MKFVSLVIVVLIFTGCDSVQTLKGHIVDEDSNRTLSAVEIQLENGNVYYSDRYGEFQIPYNSNIVQFKHSLKLHLKKDNYEELIDTFQPLGSDEIEIRLKKSFETTVIRNDIMDTVRRIELDNFISSGVIGEAANEPKQYNRRRWFRLKATDIELLQLINYPNPIIQATAFEELYRRGNQEVPMIMEKLSKSEDGFKFYSGCLGYSISLGEYCFVNVMNYELTPNATPPLPSDFRRRVELNEDVKKKILARLNKK